jgi:hypothetical protein
MNGWFWQPIVLVRVGYLIGTLRPNAGIQLPTFIAAKQPFRAPDRRPVNAEELGKHLSSALAIEDLTQLRRAIRTSPPASFIRIWMKRFPRIGRRLSNLKPKGSRLFAPSHDRGRRIGGMPVIKDIDPV